MLTWLFMYTRLLAALSPCDCVCVAPRTGARRDAVCVCVCVCVSGSAPFAGHDTYARVPTPYRFLVRHVIGGAQAEAGLVQLAALCGGPVRRGRWKTVEIPLDLVLDRDEGRQPRGVPWAQVDRLARGGALDVLAKRNLCAVRDTVPPQRA